MGRHQRGWRVFALGTIVSLALLVVSCLGEDWKLTPLEVGYQHHRSTIQIEPDEEFGVVLRANGLFPEEPWQVAEIDTAMVELTGQFHDEEVRAAGDWVGGEGSAKPWLFIPTTDFGFVATTEGVSRLVLHLTADGGLVDVYELTVAVVDDACHVDEDRTGVVTPVRCTGERYLHIYEGELPPGAALIYDDYRWAVRLEAGDEFTLALRANGMHPNVAWQVAEIDTSVLDLQRSIHASGEPASADTTWSSTIFPETRFEFIGKALGESPLILEMRSGDELLDIYEVTVFVVDDACDLGPDRWKVYTPHLCD